MIDRGSMVDLVGEPATLEQLAEECAELGKAALKVARIIRNENPTPVTIKEADASLLEEWTDVYQVAFCELGLFPDHKQIDRKSKRLRERMGIEAEKDE